MYEKGPALLMLKPRVTAFREIRYPEFTPDSIVVKTAFSGISSGTGTNLFDGRLSQVWYPLVPGYENVGEVVAVGEKAAERYHVNDRVMANEIFNFPDVCGAWGGQVAFSVRNLEELGEAVRIPDTVSYEEAVIAYLASVALKGVEITPAEKGKTVLVTGMGTIGLSAVQIFKDMGLRVFALEKHPKRLELAARFADEIIDPTSEDPVEKVKKLTEGKMLDIVYEASGNPSLASATIDFLRWGHGHVHFQGHYTKPVVFTDWQKWFGDHTMSATCANTPAGKRKILGMIADGRFDAKSLYSEVRSIRNAQGAYEDVLNNPADHLKILFDWRGQG